MLNFIVRTLGFPLWISHDKWCRETLRNKGYKIVNFRNRKGVAQVLVAKAPIIDIEDYY